MRARLAVILVACLTSVLRAQGTLESTIEISGRVTDSITGRGVSGALVVLYAGLTKAQLGAQPGQGAAPRPPAAPSQTLTDENGKYSFSIAEPSFASVRVTHVGYLDGMAQASGNYSQGMNVSLVPTGVIEGRVGDGAGEAMPGVIVDILQQQIKDGRRMVSPLMSARTNDLGEYRFWNVAPSTVYVCATATQGTSESFPTSYFPGAPDRNSAQAMRVLPGQDLRADFALKPRKAYRIRGVVQGTAAYPRVNVRLLNGEDPASRQFTVNIATGQFQVVGAAPGNYVLQAYSVGGGALALGEVNVAVGEQDVSDVVVRLSTGVDVSGTIVHLPAGQTPPATGGPLDDDNRDDVLDNRSVVQRPLRSLPVQVTILEPGRLPVPGKQPPAQVDADGDFTFTDMLPGKYAFTLPTGGEYIESMRSGTTDVLADGLEVGAGSPSELKITLRSGGGSIQGFVSGLQAGEAGTVVLVRSTGLAGIPNVVAAFNNPSTGEASFYAGNLAPGQYSVYAWPSDQQVEYRNPDVLRSLSGGAVSVTLHEFGNEQIEVKATPPEVR
jgi:hypothetical protein